MKLTTKQLRECSFETFKEMVEYEYNRYHNHFNTDVGRHNN